MTQRDGREGGGRRVQDGNTCMPVVDSFRYMAEPIQYCKVKKNKNKIKLKKKKKKKRLPGEISINSYMQMTPP